MPIPRPRGPKDPRALVGRDAELATLTQLLAPTTPTRFAVVTGAHGSGCTSLLRAVSELAAEHGTAVLAGFSITDARRPYGTLLAPLLDPTPGSAAHPGIPGTSAQRLHELARNAAREPIDHLPAFVEEYARAVDALAGPQQTVLIIDDAQAADAESLAALPLMARRLTNSRWIVAAHVHGESYLPVRGAVGHLLDNALPGDTVRVRLGPCTDADLAVLVRQSVGLRPSGQLMSSAAYHLGDLAGLPGPTIRFITTQRADRRIRRIDSLDYLVDPTEPAGLSVADPLVVELGGMNGETALVLSVIAALGRAEPQTLLDLADVHGIEPVRLSRRIDKLVDTGLLSLDGRSRLRVAVPALAHTLIEHTAGQAEVHQRLVGALLISGDAGTMPQTQRLADHLSLALSTALDATQGSLPGRADPRDLPALPATLAVLVTAIRSAGSGDGSGGGVDTVRLRRWGRTLLRVLTRLSPGEIDADAAGADRDALHAVPDVVADLWRLGYPADAAAIGLRALDLVAARPGGDALAAARPGGDDLRDAMSVATAASVADCGDLAKAEQLLATVDLDRLAGTRLLAPAARLLTVTQRPEQARRLLDLSGSPTDPAVLIERVALEAMWGDGDRWTAAWNAWCAAGLAGSDIDGERIRERVGFGGEDVARAMLLPAFDGRRAPDGDETRVIGAWLDGDWDRVADRAGRLAACSTTGAPARRMQVARALAAEVWLHRGELRRSLRWVRPISDDRAAVPVVPWALSGALHANGEPATAQAHLMCTIDGYLRSGRLPGLDLLLARLADQQLDRGDLAGAHDAGRRLAEVADALGSRQARLLNLSVQARLGGDPDAAEAALALATTAGMRFQRARLHLLCGQLGREPTSHLHEALRLFHTLRAQPWAQQVSAALRLRGDAVPRQRGSASALTAAEVEIAELVAAGLGNRRIATRLGLSEKTVEGALTRILTKTGWRNRVELAVRYRPQDSRHP